MSGSKESRHTRSRRHPTASRSWTHPSPRPTLKAVVEGIEHTISGPPQAVAITPDGKLAVIGAPSRYDYDAKKESFGTYLQLVDLEARPRS